MVRKPPSPRKKKKIPAKREFLRMGSAIAAALLLVGAGSFFATRRPSGGDEASETANPVATEDSKTDVYTRFEKGELTTKEIAVKLGYGNEAAALEDAKVFLDRVRGGFIPKGWGETCRAEHNSALCTAVEEYFVDALTPTVRRSRPRARPLSVPLKAKFVAKLQGDDFQTLLSALSNKSVQALREFGDKARTHTGCPRNLSLATARILEKHTQKKGVLELMNALDDHAVECLKPSDPLAEFHFLRIGLFRWAQGRKEGALELFRQAPLAADKREEHRALYWVWRAARDLGKNDIAEESVRRLHSQFPLSWYAIISHHELGTDPLDFFQKNAPVADLFPSGDQNFDRAFLWGVLMLRADPEERGLGRYAETLTKAIPENIPPGAVQYFARSMDKAGEHRAQIVALTNFLNARPQAVSPLALRLLFPRPFYDDIARLASPLLDFAVLLGLARQESSFNVKAVSTANAKGLFQVLPSTARSIKRNVKLHDYLHNIEVGTKYFLKLVQSFDGSVEKALASYNAGRGNVNKWEENYAFVRFDPDDPQLWSDLIPFRETRDYVSTVLRNAYWYHRLYPDLRERLGKGMLTSPQLLRFVLPHTERGR